MTKVGNLLKFLLFIGIAAVIVYAVKGVFTKDTWDLMVCKTLMEDGVQCYDNSYVLKGYKTQAGCMEKGLELAKKEGFECGKNCKETSYCKEPEDCILSCEIICNKNGCN